MFWKLFEDLALNISLIVTLAYLMSRTKLFRRMLRGKANTQEKIFLVLFFGGIGIAGTYTGIDIKGALANSRVIGVAVGGLLGGPLVGIAAGLLAGGHRTLLGGLTAIARTKKISYTMTTFLPMLFMGVTSTTAGYLTIVNNYIPKHQTLPAVLAGVMIILAAIIVADSIRKLLQTYTSILSDEVEKNVAQ